MWDNGTMGHWDKWFCIVWCECGMSANGLVWIIIYIINIYINNIYNNYNKWFCPDWKIKNTNVPLSHCPNVPSSFDFVEFLLARHSSNKFGSALASFVILTFEINRTIIAGNYCFASEIFVLLHCQQSRRNLRPNQATKIAKRAGTCFLGKSQNSVKSVTSEYLWHVDTNPGLAGVLKKKSPESLYDFRDLT